MQQKTVRGPAILESMHSSGKCLADMEGKKVYLDFGIPGEQVAFLQHRRKQGFRSGEVVEVLKPSEFRVDPFCMHHQQCGGCPWQHISYSHQLKLKHEILCNALTKYGILTPEVPPVISSPQIHYYRHRVEYTFADQSYCNNIMSKRNVHAGALGFHKYAEPEEVIDIKECYLQEQPSRAVCDFVKTYALEQGLSFYHHKTKSGFLRSLSIRTNRSGETMIVLGFNQELPLEREHLLRKLKQELPGIVSLCWTNHISHLHSQLQGYIIPFEDDEPYLYKLLGGNRFRVHASSFFQPNPGQAEKIFLTIQDWADLTGSEKVYDLYAGVGTIALFLAAKARHVTGIENSTYAVDDAKTNATMNGFGNIDFIAGDTLETFKPDLFLKHGKPDVIALDPPRSGTLIEIKKTINGSGAEKVIYLSCNPVSLAYDLKQLTEVYSVTRIQPFDMLPHTHHLETLVLLEHK